VREVLVELARTASTYVVSGRPASVLESWLGELPIGLVCEHGLSIKHPDGSWSEPPRIDQVALEEMVLPLFRDFCDRTPGSRIERKAASLAWHYRGSDPRLGAWRANELSAQLGARLGNQPFSVLMGSRVIEVRHATITKGAAAARILAAHPETDFVLCAGNDRTDEDMFHEVAARQIPAVVVYVGGAHTSAEFFVETPAELMDQLGAAVEAWRHLPPVGTGAGQAPGGPDLGSPERSGLAPRPGP
jgi:trehalose 6-phosphate synthase/phosphatase